MLLYMETILQKISFRALSSSLVRKEAQDAQPLARIYYMNI